ncbi:tetratricopeptide repeat protein [Falsiroseomonas sp. E2-1-a4]|uniref:tetratricopeptide repeat protein n=1 Tax=Falsiroseomonas sp. E2-1-a4 TaxID=3239299 RepID=UPI003F3D6541
MQRQTRTVLLGAFAAAALTALGAIGWVALTPTPAQTAEDHMPTPPQPPRLADGPEFERCLGLLRNDPEAARAFAEAWGRAGGGEGARQCQALALLSLGEPALAAQRLETLATQSAASSLARAAVYAQATQAWLMAGEANRAYGAATLALTLSPEDVDLLVDRAVTLGSLSRYNEAIEDLDRALALDPNRAEALVFRAAANRHMDRVDLSARDIERALQSDPASAEALLERGIIRQLRGDTVGAREDWQRAITLSPNSPTADLAAQNLALNEAGPARR